MAAASPIQSGMVGTDMQELDDALDDVVDDAAEVAGDAAEQHAEHEADRDADEADRGRDARAVDQAAEARRGRAGRSRAGRTAGSGSTRADQVDVGGDQAPELVGLALTKRPIGMRTSGSGAKTRRSVCGSRLEVKPVTCGWKCRPAVVGVEEMTRCGASIVIGRIVEVRARGGDELAEDADEVDQDDEDRAPERQPVLAELHPDEAALAERGRSRPGPLAGRSPPPRRTRRSSRSRLRA